MEGRVEAAARPSPSPSSPRRWWCRPHQQPPARSWERRWKSVAAPTRRGAVLCAVHHPDQQQIIPSDGDDAQREMMDGPASPPSNFTPLTAAHVRTHHTHTHTGPSCTPQVRTDEPIHPILAILLLSLSVCVWQVLDVDKCHCGLLWRWWWWWALHLSLSSACLSGLEEEA